MTKTTLNLITYTFDDGATFNGTADQLLKYAAFIGESINVARLGGKTPKGYYLSSRQGLVKISDMDTTHLMNALNKRVVDYYTRIRPTTRDFDVKKYLLDFMAMTESPEIEEMFTELSKRKK